MARPVSALRRIPCAGGTPRRYLAVFAGATLTAAANPGFTQDAQTEKALKLITETVPQICQTPPLEQTSTGTKLSGEAQAKVEGIIGRLANIGVKGAGDYQNSHSIGVLQQDLAKAIESSNNCKLEVFRTLSKDLLGRSQEGTPAQSLNPDQHRWWQHVPGIGDVEVAHNDVFILTERKGGALLRNLSTINSALREGKSDTLYSANDPSGGVFYVWITNVSFDEGDRCVHFRTLYERFNKEWGLWRACEKTMEIYSDMEFLLKYMPQSAH